MAIVNYPGNYTYTILLLSKLFLGKLNDPNTKNLIEIPHDGNFVAVAEVAKLRQNFDRLL